LFKCTNQIVSHDNYYEKYLPIRVQSQINDTLKSILEGKLRRRLELYDNDKSKILYQALLCDDGTGDIINQMRNLHIKATIEIEEEERRAKQRSAIYAANVSSTYSNADDQIQRVSIVGD
jgi:hypothetical protein